MAGWTWEFVPFAVTSPAQPLRIAAEAIRVTAVAAHTPTLVFSFTLVTFSERNQLASWGGGGVRRQGWRVLPELCGKDKNSEPSLLLVPRTVLVQARKTWSCCLVH